MKGVEFPVDELGEKKVVLIDLRHHRDPWEDFYDTLKTIERKEEPRDTLAKVVRNVYHVIRDRKPSDNPIQWEVVVHGLPPLLMVKA